MLGTRFARCCSISGRSWADAPVVVDAHPASLTAVSAAAAADAAAGDADDAAAAEIVMWPAGTACTAAETAELAAFPMLDYVQ